MGWVSSFDASRILEVKETSQAGSNPGRGDVGELQHIVGLFGITWKPINLSQILPVKELVLKK